MFYCQEELWCSDLAQSRIHQMTLLLNYIFSCFKFSLVIRLSYHTSIDFCRVKTIFKYTFKVALFSKLIRRVV